MKRGYIGQGENKEEVYKALQIQGVDSFHAEVDDLFSVLSQGDEIVIQETSDFNMSSRDLASEMMKLKGKEMTLHVVDQFTIELDTYLIIVGSIIDMEQKWLNKKIKKGIETARRNGNSIGRPKISEEKINEIIYLHAQHLTFRDISEKLGVSLGTVHKYVARGGNDKHTDSEKE